MRCPQCRRAVGGHRATCTACGFEFRTSVTAGPRLDRVTETGPIGPLADLVLREAPSARNLSRAHRLGPAQSPGRHSGSPPVRRSQVPSATSQRRLPISKADGSLISERASTASQPVGDGNAIGTDPRRCLGRRLAACLIDSTLLFGINVAVIYFTLRLAGLEIDGMGQLPPIPLVGFLFVFDLAYLVVLTAFGGQTVGKMAVGLRVERTGGEPVKLVGALARTIAYAVSVLPAGLGFVGVFLRRKQTLHDLIADTRVVRVS